MNGLILWMYDFGVGVGVGGVEGAIAGTFS